MAVPTRAMNNAASHANAGGPISIAIQEHAVSENPAAGLDGAGFRRDGAADTRLARTVPQVVAFNLPGREAGALPEGPHGIRRVVAQPCGAGS